MSGRSTPRIAVAGSPGPRALAAARRTAHASRLALAAGLAGVTVLAACETPFERPETPELAAIIAASSARESAGSPTDSAFRVPTQPRSDVLAALAPREEQLAKVGPRLSSAGSGLDVGEDLYGQKPPEAQLGLQQAVATAVRNNLGIQSAKLEQAVSQADVVMAEAAFDAVLVASTAFSRFDQPTIVLAAPGEIIPESIGNDGQSWTMSTGVQQRLVTGATVGVSTSWEYQRLLPPGFFFPNPSWTNNIQVGMSQPLLQGFGSDVNLAQVRLARNADRKSMQDLRLRLLDLVARTEAAYWRLVLARNDLAIRQWLVAVGVEVRDVLAKRRQFDTTLAQYADAVAVVENRKSAVIRARRQVLQAVDDLKVLMNDPNLPVGSETMVVPTDLMVDQPLQVSLREAIATSVEQSPEVAKALLDIDDAAIRQVVADNGRLPQLNLNAQAQWNGLDDGFGTSFDQVFQGQYVDYLVGLSFSQAIGNRAGEAGYRAARLRRSQAVIGYRSAVQQSVYRVKESLRQVVTNYQLIEQTRAFRLAQAENLRALLVDEQTIASLTPEFLNLKFQRQDGLASAQLQEITSLVDYNTAVADLYRAMGNGLAMNRIEIDTKDATDAAK